MKKKFIYLVILIGLIALIYFRFANRTSSQLITYEDKNSNGIWDDVEPFIKANAKNELEEKALKFKFQAFQKVLLNPAIGKEIKNGDHSKHILSRASACLYKIIGVENTIALDTEDAIVTTPARVRAYIEYNKNLSGGFYSLWEDEHDGNPCPFEVTNSSEN